MTNKSIKTSTWVCRIGACLLVGTVGYIAGSNSRDKELRPQIEELANRIKHLEADKVKQQKKSNDE